MEPVNESDIETPKPRVQRLDSLQSLPEIELGENVFVKNSALVDTVNESLKDPSASPEISISANDEIEVIVEELVNEVDAQNKENLSVNNEQGGVPIVFRKFLRRFSEDDRIVEDALTLRYFSFQFYLFRKTVNFQKFSDFF